MFLTVLKHGDAWDTMENLFKINGATFKKLISIFIPIVADNFHECLNVDLVSKYILSYLVTLQKKFLHFKQCLYASDVTFQKYNRPSGTMKGFKDFDSVSINWTVSRLNFPF